MWRFVGSDSEPEAEVQDPESPPHKRARVEHSSFLKPLPGHDQVSPLAHMRVWRKNMKAEFDKEANANRIRPRIDVSTDSMREFSKCDGDQRLRKIRYWLDNFPNYARSVDQKEFHTNFIQATLPRIYGHEWETNSIRVMEEMKLQRIQYEVLAQTPRRFGKTVAVAMYMAVMAVFVPGVRIAAYSTGKRASGALLGWMIRFMKFIPGSMRRIIKKNHEELFLAANELPANQGPGSAKAKEAESAEDTSRIYSYPSSVNGKLLIPKFYPVVLFRILLQVQVYYIAVVHLSF